VAQGVDGDVQAALPVLKIIEARCRRLGLERPSWARRKPVDLVPPEHVEEYARVLRETQQRNRDEPRESAQEPLSRTPASRR
jgi:hypothetical protein